MNAFLFIQKRNIQKLLFFFFIVSFLFACRTTQSTSKNTTQKNDKERAKKTEILLKEASSYVKTRYKAGGVNHEGMDCSGLVFTCYKKIDLQLPRVSREQGNIGTQIKLDEALPGDLIFFATSGKGKGINHVGIVTKKDEKTGIYFLHSTLKLGVTESNLQESYYQNSFVKIMRLY